jgi:hypothetical protein
MNDYNKIPPHENKRWLSCENVTSDSDIWHGWAVNMFTHKELNEPAIHHIKQGVER